MRLRRSVRPTTYLGALLSVRQARSRYFSRRRFSRSTLFPLAASAQALVVFCPLKQPAATDSDCQAGPTLSVPLPPPSSSLPQCLCLCPSKAIHQPSIEPHPPLFIYFSLYSYSLLFSALVPSKSLPPNLRRHPHLSLLAPPDLILLLGT